LYPHSENASSALTNSGILYEALQQYLIAARIFEKLGTADGILRASRLYQKAHMPADHMRLFKQYMARFPDSPESAYYTLKAQYNSLEAERHQFDAMTIQSKVGRVQGQQLKAKTAKLLELKKKYEAVVVKYGLSEWTVASVYQIGALYENLFRAMLAAPCPADVEKIDESACDEYQSLLEDKAMVLEGKAIDAFKLTLEKSALTPDATEWSFAAQDALHNLRPNDFPMSVRPLTQPIDVALGQAELKALQQSARARLEVNAKDMTARLDMAKAFYSDTKYEAAKMVLEDSLAMDANQPLMNEWLGYTLREEHDTVPAIAALEKSLAADDKLAIAKDSLALLLLTRGDLDRALMLLIEVTPALPESAILQLQVGNAYLLLGRYIEAIARYNEAIQLKSDLLDAYYNLGLANMIAEKFEAAKENLVHYIEHSRDEASKKNAQAYLVTVNRKIQIEAQRRAREKEAVHEEVVSPDAAPSE
jgi:tetratricopeptide (TPR) repeat protein